MADIHWFDRLNKSLIGSTSRRGLLQTVGPLLAGLASTTGAAAPKRKKRPRKPPPKPKRSCSKGVCNGEWRSKQDRGSCEATCKRCKRTGTEFCVEKRNGAKVADCCAKGQPCCGNQCCPPWKSDEGPVPSKCCKGECCPETWDCCGRLCCPKDTCCQKGNVSFCLSAGTICCPDSETGLCSENEYCCPGIGCVADQQACECATSSDVCCNFSCDEPYVCCPDDSFISGAVCTYLPTDPRHCKACANACPPQWACCPSGCVDIWSDPQNCGSCTAPGRVCWPGQICRNGLCAWP